MELNLYIDVIFLVNYVMDFFLLLLLKGILKKPSSVKRISCGALAGGVFGCLEVWLWSAWKASMWFMPVVSLGAAGLMAVTAFGRSDLREMAKQMGSLYLLAVLADGIMELLYQHTGAGIYFGKMMQGEGVYAMPLLKWLFLAAGSCLLVRGLWQFGDQMAKERAGRYPVVLASGDVVVETTGYLDTGNCLTEPVSGQGVQVVAERIWDLFQKTCTEKVMIPYHTVGNPFGVMQGMRIERMEIGQAGGTGKKGERGKITISRPWIAKAPYALTRDGSYEVLLHGEAGKGGS